MKLLDLEQGSQQWLEIRKNYVGASDAPAIMDLSPYKTPLQLWGEKVGLIQEKELTAAMQRGKNVEERARQRACLEMGMAFIPKVAISEIYPWMLASFDGISEDGTIIEIKSNGKKARKFVDEGQIPPYHYPQLIHQMIVADSRKAFYYSFDEEESTILEVEFDEEFAEKLIERERIFLDCVKTLTPPL